MKDKISLKIYLRLYKEHCKLLCEYIKLKSKYEKIIQAYDEDWLEAMQ